MKVRAGTGAASKGGLQLPGFAGMGPTPGMAGMSVSTFQLTCTSLCMRVSVWLRGSCALVDEGVLCADARIGRGIYPTPGMDKVNMY